MRGMNPSCDTTVVVVSQLLIDTADGGGRPPGVITPRPRRADGRWTELRDGGGFGGCTVLMVLFQWDWERFLEGVPYLVSASHPVGPTVCVSKVPPGGVPLCRTPRAASRAQCTAS